MKFLSSVLLAGTLVGIVAADEPMAATSAPPATEFVLKYPSAYPGPEAPSVRYRWERIDGEYLTLVGPSGIIWRLNFAQTLDVPYFDPLQTTDGRQLV